MRPVESKKYLEKLQNELLLRISAYSRVSLVRSNAKAPCVELYLAWRKLSAIRICQYALLQETDNTAMQNPVVFNDYRYSVTTVHPSGMPLTPLTFHLASLLFTNVPVDETPESQL